jgi:type II secretory pathway component GspD/PulD (secretin)
MSSRNWHEEREQWEQDRALYELELQKAYAEASNRRARWLMAAFACHAMTAMLVVGMLSLLLAIGAPEALAGKAPFTFENAEIEVVIKKASELTGLAFLYDPEQVKGRITLYLPDKVSPDKVLQPLRLALAIHGYSLLRKDNTVWIVPGEQAAHLEVVPLDNAEAEELAAALAHLAPYGVRIVPYYPTNSLLIYGDPQGVKEVIRVIKGGTRCSDPIT